MSIAPARDRGQPTIRTREKAEAYLRERAPVDWNEARNIALAVYRAYLIGRPGEFDKRTIDGFALARAMRAHWFPKLDTSEESEELFGLAESVKEAFEAHEDRLHAEKLAERKAAWSRTQQTHDERIAAKRAADEQRKERAAKVKKIAAGLSCSARYARMLLDEGTSLPERAEQLAKILGTDPKDHLRPKRKSGRQPDMVAWFMGLRLDDCSFRDFLNSDPETEGDGASLIEALRDGYASGPLASEDCQSLEDLIEHARRLGVDSSVVEAASAVWRAFKLWRIDLIAALAHYTIEDTP